MSQKFEFDIPKISLADDVIAHMAQLSNSIENLSNCHAAGIAHGFEPMRQAAKGGRGMEVSLIPSLDIDFELPCELSEKLLLIGEGFRNLISEACRRTVSVPQKNRGGCPVGSGYQKNNAVFIEIAVLISESGKLESSYAAAKWVVDYFGVTQDPAEFGKKVRVAGADEYDTLYRAVRARLKQS